jgi:hypothetical protein
MLSFTQKEICCLKIRKNMAGSVDKYENYATRLRIRN